ncbi:10161_t:CDS:10, partial [Acaulospora colombiana]
NVDGGELIPKAKRLLKEKSDSEKLQEVFRLTKPEQLRGEYRCTLLRYIMLQGVMYLTDDHSSLQESEQSSILIFGKQDLTLKDGNLWKRSIYGTYDRYYFTLQNDVLMYYEDPMDSYCPAEIIDLKYALRVEKSKNKNGFKIIVPNQTYRFSADTEQSMNEWVAHLERSIVRANNDGDSVKIVIPIESIQAIVNNLSMNLPNTIQINTQDSDEPSSYDEYFFTFPSGGQILYKNLYELWKSHKSSQSMQDSAAASTRIMDSLRSITTHGREKSSDEIPSYPTSPKSPKTSSLASNAFTRRVSILLKNPAKYISTFDENPSEEAGVKFRNHFALKNERLNATFYGYFLRMVPLYGKFYISDNYICYKSKVFGMTSNIVLPLLDIHFFKMQKSTTLGYYGLEILTKAQQEMFFEFGFREIRDRFVEILENQIKILLGKDKKHAEDGRAYVSFTFLFVLFKDDQLLLANVLPNSPTISNFGNTGLKKQMHITCLTIGSRGDVQPYIALAKGLMKEGHKVRIASHGEYKDWIEGHGIEFGYVGGDPAELMFRVWLDDLLKTSWEACQNTDLIIESPNAMSGIHIAEALDFIDDNHKNGKKVVYIGFGSIVVDNPKELTRTIVNSVVKSGVAAILSKGWSDRLQLKSEDDAEVSYPSCIYQLKSVPHDWLFPRIDAVVHHGGAGTTAAGLRAGVPTIIRPFFGDQFFWGDRVENMEIGFCIKKLTVDKLSDYLVRVVNDPKIIEKAKLVGENIRKEDGVENAIQSIYKYYEHAKHRIKLQRERTAVSNSLVSTGTGMIGDLKAIGNLKSIASWNLLTKNVNNVDDSSNKKALDENGGNEQDGELIKHSDTKDEESIKAITT